MSAYTERISPALDRRIPAALVAAFLLQTAGYSPVKGGDVVG